MAHVGLLVGLMGHDVVVLEWTIRRGEAIRELGDGPVVVGELGDGALIFRHFVDVGEIASSRSRCRSGSCSPNGWLLVILVAK